ncbi:McrB family protein [Dyadobacter sandarakinus]|uniref:AAA family ATPase n=1 Tax=Dyadobacter sandarakinus TaxID=2747268 RepID=A0ABX7I2P5_9BACT|nr:AAA family ATPase [Dyadobacter sandarakinus]QRQ99507.1 AAA family ATPase [Dyadobacter sandarakinus]
MTYPELESAVYETLWHKHEQDPSFTFSVRKKASKGAEADYFIGTKASNYLGFTCWHVPIYYPGASIDFCSFIVKPLDNGFEYQFQVFTPNAAEALEENPALQICHYLANQIAFQLTEHGIEFRQSIKSNAMLWFGIYPKSSKSNSGGEAALSELKSFIDGILPAVDAAITDTKKEYPDFSGKRIELAAFQHMLAKMKIRQDRYKTSTDSASEESDLSSEDLPIPVTMQIDSSILPSKNLLLYGPPGTGKTYYLQTKLFDYFQEEGKPIRYSFVTFHQAFTYEDFIEGLKPIVGQTGGGQISYTIEPGIFYKACDEAAKLAGFDSLSQALAVTQEERETRFEQAPPYALFIDEINRANVSATFGELITLLETNKRLGADQEITSLILPYSKKPFGVPLNLYVIGTMNTADRSIEALDTALRRRFIFREISPDPSLLNRSIADIPLHQLLTTINHRLERLGNREQRVGHAFLTSVETEQQLVDAFSYSIVPLLQEYFYNDYRKIGLVLGRGFVEERISIASFADFDADLASEYEEVVLWDLKPVTLDAIRGVL